MIYPLVPLYLASVLMAGPRALGIIEGLAEATAALLKLFSGVILDRTGVARPWILGGYTLAGFARPLIALASSWPMVMVLRFADRVGKGLRSSPRDALIARSVDAQTRGLAFGVHRALDNAGAVVASYAYTPFGELIASSGSLDNPFTWQGEQGVMTEGNGLYYMRSRYYDSSMGRFQ